MEGLCTERKREEEEEGNGLRWREFGSAVEGMRETSPEMGWWRNPGEEGCGEGGGGGDGGAAVRRRRLEDGGVARAAEKNPWPGQGVAAVVAAAAAVGLLPWPYLSSHLRGSSLLSFFK